MEIHVWEAWIGQKIVRCESGPDGSTYIQLEDGRGAMFNTPLWYSSAGPADPLEVAEIAL